MAAQVDSASRFTHSLASSYWALLLTHSLHPVPDVAAVSETKHLQFVILVFCNGSELGYNAVSNHGRLRTLLKVENRLTPLSAGSYAFGTWLMVAAPNPSIS